jgi:hypothetical protein
VTARDLYVVEESTELLDYASDIDADAYLNIIRRMSAYEKTDNIYEILESAGAGIDEHLFKLISIRIDTDVQLKHVGVVNIVPQKQNPTFIMCKYGDDTHIALRYVRDKVPGGQISDELPKYLIFLTNKFNIVERIGVPIIQSLAHIVSYLQDTKHASSYFLDMVRRVDESTLDVFIHDCVKYLFDDVTSNKYEGFYNLSVCVGINDASLVLDFLENSVFAK